MDKLDMVRAIIAKIAKVLFLMEHAPPLKNESILWFMLKEDDSLGFKPFILSHPQLGLLHHAHSAAAHAAAATHTTTAAIGILHLLLKLI